MIVIRPHIESDLEFLEPFGFIPKKIEVSSIAEVDGVPRIGVFARKTSEIYMVADPALSDRRERLGLFLALHKEIYQPMLRAGFTDAHSWTNDARFGKLLMHLSWTKALWPCYHLETQNG